MLTRIAILWHSYVSEHITTEVKVSVPLWDPSAKGILVKCECGKSWAL